MEDNWITEQDKAQTPNTKKPIATPLSTSLSRAVVLLPDNARKVPADVVVEIRVFLDESIDSPAKHLLKGCVNDASSS